MTSAVPPAASIFSFAVALKPWARTVSFFEISPWPRTLTGCLRVASPAARSGVGRDLGAGIEPRLEVGEVDRLAVRAEGLERHRLLHVRAAQLAHPHVDRVLAALVAALVLGAGASVGALVAAARRSCRCRCPCRGRAACGRASRPASGGSCAGRCLRGRGGPSVLRTSSTRWETFPSAPRNCGVIGQRGLLADPAQLERRERAALPRAGAVGGADLLERDVSHRRTPPPSARLRLAVPRRVSARQGRQAQPRSRRRRRFASGRVGRRPSAAASASRRPP